MEYRLIPLVTLCPALSWLKGCSTARLIHTGTGCDALEPTRLCYLSATSLVRQHFRV
jgi:hypothetical protein